MSYRTRPIGESDIEAVECPHCGREGHVRGPGTMVCSECGGWFEVVEEDDHE